VIGSLFKVSNTLGGGFLEKVYENAAVIEIAKTGLSVKQQYHTTGLPVCLLVNFYRPKLEIKRIVANSSWNLK
jgi:hypothetical protein